jgi:hypothetical protein
MQKSKFCTKLFVMPFSLSSHSIQGLPHSGLMRQIIGPSISNCDKLAGDTFMLHYELRAIATLRRQMNATLN